MSRKTAYFECFCTDMSHTLKFSYDEADGDNWPPSFYAEIYLNVYLPWYKRIIPAIKYLFGSTANTQGHFGSWHLQSRDATNLVLMASEFADAVRQFKETHPNYHWEPE